jgi:ubiquinol-cytochrome c reductase cytochrome b subunit
MSLWGIFFAQNDALFWCGTLNVLPLKIPSNKRIGPHNKNIFEFIYGSLLGDGYLEHHGNGCRLCIQQENSNNGYLIWLHHYLSSLEYTNSKIPTIKVRIGNNNKLRYLLRFKTWTYSSFNPLHQLWYKNGIKILPFNIEYYLTPLALAIWIMDDGSRAGKGLKLATKNFTYNECNLLTNILRIKYDLKISIHKTGHINQWSLYIHKDSINQL